MSRRFLKREYGPSLVQLAAPHWRRASTGVRALVVAGAVVLLGVLAAAALTLENAGYSHGGPVPFSFEYRGLYRAAPEHGEFVRVQSRWPDGSVKNSYAVGPLVLPPYSGELNGELPLFAAGFIHALSRQYAGFALRAEGKTRISTKLTGYEVAFFANVEGRRVYARDVLLTPAEAHPRAGVVVTMLTSPKASAQVDSPLEVGDTGVLVRPLKSFAFG
jgi:hypothetical protein